MSFDPKCKELAEYFMDDVVATPQQVDKLAQTIQDIMEDFLSDLESDRVQELEAAKDEAIERKLDLKREGSL